MRYRSHLLAGALCAALLLVCPDSWAQISLSIGIAPPPLPVYTQPPLPRAGYLWVPGYWAWADGDYYWVPGTWVIPPQPGLLWTPGYWGWSDGAYFWHEGYWAPEVGFYGGVDYGFGYDGIGFIGGYWSRGAFYYNRAVNRIPRDERFEHVYSRPPRRDRDRDHDRVSFNGGREGVHARPTAAQLAAGRERHFDPIEAQRLQQQTASRAPELRAGANHGRPPIGATARPGRFGANLRIPERANRRPAPAPVPQPQSQPRPRPFFAPAAPVAPPRATPRAVGPRREAIPRPPPAPREFAPPLLRPAAPHREAAPRPNVVAPQFAPPRPGPVARPFAPPRAINRAPPHPIGRPAPAPRGGNRQPERQRQ